MDPDHRVFSHIEIATGASMRPEGVAISRRTFPSRSTDRLGDPLAPVRTCSSSKIKAPPGSQAELYIVANKAARLTMRIYSDPRIAATLWRSLWPRCTSSLRLPGGALDLCSNRSQPVRSGPQTIVAPARKGLREWATPSGASRSPPLFRYGRTPLWSGIIYLALRRLSLVGASAADVDHRNPVIGSAR